MLGAEMCCVGYANGQWEWRGASDRAVKAYLFSNGHSVKRHIARVLHRNGVNGSCTGEGGSNGCARRVFVVIESLQRRNLRRGSHQEWCRQILRKAGRIRKIGNGLNA